MFNKFFRKKLPIISGYLPIIIAVLPYVSFDVKMLVNMLEIFIIIKSH